MLLLLLLVVLVSGAPQDRIRFDSSRDSFIDGDERQRIFHGVNVVYKLRPWIPKTTEFDPFLSFSDVDIDNLKRWGMNIVRLGAMWPGVEPVKGIFNESYISEISLIVQKLAKRGIYTLLDFHQDVLSEKYCGEGVPLWAAQADELRSGFPEPLAWKPFDQDENQIPRAADCSAISWGEYYFAKATARAYQNFYQNRDGIRDHFVGYWKRLAMEFKSVEHVIGYEIMNEPWVGDFYADPSLIIPGVAEKKLLEPFYNVVNEGIREVDRDSLIFFEGVTFDDFISSGFTAAPGGSEFGNQSVLSYHYYYVPNFSRDVQFSTRIRDAKRMGCGAMLTEFNLTVDEISTMELADSYRQSWIGWAFKSFANITGDSSSIYLPSGDLNQDMIQALTRTYPQAIAGELHSFKFDAQTTDFEMKLTPKLSCNLPSEIFAAFDIHYRSCVYVSVEPRGALNFEISRNENLIRLYKNKQTKEGIVITVKLSSQLCDK
jgi:endoglycosylceramidase